MQDNFNIDVNKYAKVLERLRHFIRLNYQTQKKLSDTIQMKTSQLSHIVAGNTKVGYETLDKLHQAGCSADWLLFGEGEMWALNDIGQNLKQNALNMGGVAITYHVADSQNFGKVASAPPPLYKATEK